jgi:hypothetical protein
MMQNSGPIGERERFLDAQPAPPRHDDQRADPEAVAVVVRLAGRLFGATCSNSNRVVR